MTTLTSDQEAASKAFFKFLMTDERYFIISGSAGVGKTFLMGHIADSVLPRYKQSCAVLGVKADYSFVHFTATTNKAAEVLEKSVGRTVDTIHSYLGLKVTENFKTGKTNIERSKSYMVRKNRIVFIDESSMIDSALLSFIDEALPSCKIVFVGDHAQMSPVNEVISPIYNKVKKENFVFLKTPVRNANTPALMQLCTQWRNTVETGEFTPIIPVPGVIDQLTPQEMMDEISINFSTHNADARILCYTNTRVQDYNAYIRELRGLPSVLTQGEIQVVASAYMSGSYSFSVEREVRVHAANSDIYSGGYENMSESGESIQYQKVTITRADTEEQPPLEVKRCVNPGVLRGVLKHLAKLKHWQDYFALKAAYIDLRDRDACTVYKSQGSTYDTVYIDLGNIGTSYDAEQVARMIFVGVSRARTRVCLFGDLPGKYIRSEAA